MAIYFLRHEERLKGDIHFRSNLTRNGQEVSNTILKGFIELINPDEIYCSPFRRTMQTVSPYARANNKKLNIDYAIAEDAKSDVLHESDYREFPINRDYKAVVDESDEYLDKRVILFASKIHKSKKNILICSHQSTLNLLMNKLYGLEREKHEKFDMGKIYRIIDHHPVCLN